MPRDLLCEPPHIVSYKLVKLSTAISSHPNWTNYCVGYFEAILEYLDYLSPYKSPVFSKHELLLMFFFLFWE